MAYQHLFGSASGGTSGAGYKALASTPEFYNIATDDELSSYNNYSFTGGDEHPVKFCHYYKEYKKCFIQSAVSFEYDYVGRNSSIAHTLVLTGEESERLLKEHICPFNPDMFMNARKDDFERPSGEYLPDKKYEFLPCGDREQITSLIRRYFRSDDFARFILAVLLSAENGYPVYVALPGSPKEASFSAVRIMNALIPAFPSEYKKKLGFMTYVTDTYAYEDVSVYFTSGIDLRRKFAGSAYCFDLTGKDVYVGGLDDNALKENRELIRAVIVNVLSYENAPLNGFYDDILPKTDSYDRFSLSKVNDIFHMWRFLSSDEGENFGSDAACRIVTSFYDFYGIVDNKAEFLYRMNGYWEKEIEKCRAGGYAPSADILAVVNRYYPTFSEADKRGAQKIWSFVLIYSLLGGNTTIFDKLTSYEYDSSQLAADVFGNILYMYIGLICKNDTNSRMKAVYDKITVAMIKNAANGNDAARLFTLLGNTVSAMDRCYEEMSLDRSSEYSTFASAFLGYFDEGVSEKINNAGLLRKFDILHSLKETLCSTRNGLGTSVYEHFCSGCFVQSVKSAFNADSAAKMAADRKAISDFVTRADEYPEISNIEEVGIFRMFYEILHGKREIDTLFSFDPLVNKPDKQRMLAGWLGIYNGKDPDLIISLLANMSCTIASGGGIEYRIDHGAGLRAFFEATGRDREKTLHELNRFIGEIEADMQKPLYKPLGLSAFREAAAGFVNEYFFSKSVDRKTLKENEAMLKRFDKVRSVRALAEGKEKKHKLFGKK